MQYYNNWSVLQVLLLLAISMAPSQRRHSPFYAAFAHENVAISEEKRLIKQLIDNYTIDGKFGRPIKAMNATLKVGYGISLVQIMDVDEKDQVLTTNVWCKYKWRDESLFWHPEDHDNITIVRVPINTIWKPDFVLYNYADERLAEHRATMALIDPDGYVTWIPPAIFKSTCFVDTTYFPFDEQSCHMKFGSWTYNGNALDPFFIDDKEYIELSEYVPSQEWVVLEHWAQKNVAFYECCPNEPYPDLTFYLKLRRRATFYSYTLILPCVLLSFITMVLFMLPPETPAKMLLGINIFVAFFMLLLLLKESTPPTAKQIPIIGAYYCFNMVMTTCSTFLCSILVDMHYRADKRNPPGRWITFLVIDVIARSMFIYVPPAMVALQATQKRNLLRQKRLAARLKAENNRKESQKLKSDDKSLRRRFVRFLERICDCVVVKAPDCAADVKQIVICNSTTVASDEPRHRVLSNDVEVDLEDLAPLQGLTSEGLPSAATRNIKDLSPTSATFEAYHAAVSTIEAESVLPDPHNFTTCIDSEVVFGCSSVSRPRTPRLHRNLARFQEPLLASSVTVSPLKKGVFVGATTNPNQRPGVMTLGQCLDATCAEGMSPDDEWFDFEMAAVAAKRQKQSAGSCALHHHHGEGAEGQRMLPSSSFDLKHYNKFMTVADPPSLNTLTMDPVLRKLERQVELLEKVASEHASRRQSATSDVHRHRHASKRSEVESIGNPPADDDDVFMHDAKTHQKAVAAAMSISASSIEAEIHLIRDMLAKFIVRIAEKEARKRNAEAWRMISMVLDRVFLLGYVVSMILSLTTLFPQRPADLPEGRRFPNGTLIEMANGHTDEHFLKMR